MKKNTFFRRCISLLGILLIVLTLVNPAVRAEASQDWNPMIMVEEYSVTDEKIVPGQDFTLTLKLKNHSNTKNAYDVVVDIVNPEGVAPVYGTTSQVFVGEIGAGKTKDISIDYRSWPNIDGNTLDFTLTILSNLPTGSVVLRIPVGADLPVNITSTSVSSELKTNETGSVTVSFDALSEGKISSLTMVLKENGQAIASSAIGNVTAGMSKSQSFPFSFDKAGQHMVELVLQYSDELGQTREKSLGTWTVNVQKVSEAMPDTTAMGERPANGSNHNILLMGISGILIVVICLIIVGLLRRHR